MRNCYLQPLKHNFTNGASKRGSPKARKERETAIRSNPLNTYGTRKRAGCPRTRAQRRGRRPRRSTRWEGTAAAPFCGGGPGGARTGGDRQVERSLISIRLRDWRRQRPPRSLRRLRPRRRAQRRSRPPAGGQPRPPTRLRRRLRPPWRSLSPPLPLAAPSPSLPRSLRPARHEWELSMPISQKRGRAGVRRQGLEACLRDMPRARIALARPDDGPDLLAPAKPQA